MSKESVTLKRYQKCDHFKTLHCHHPGENDRTRVAATSHDTADVVTRWSGHTVTGQRAVSRFLATLGFALVLLGATLDTRPSRTVLVITVISVRLVRGSGRVVVRQHDLFHLWLLLDWVSLW